MSFIVFTDGSANLPKKLLGGIRLLPCTYYMDDSSYVYDGDIDNFDGKNFYNDLRKGKEAKTSLLNTHLFMSVFEPILNQGKDIIYVSMSSGISGTYNAAKLAAEELMEQFPQRKVEIIDSLGCGFGSGLLAVMADKLREEGKHILEAAENIRKAVPHMCQYFTVDDLNFLKRSGRISGILAKMATVLTIKPVLFGDETGHIISCAKTRGRKSSIEILAQKYANKVKDAASQIVCISHGDCIEDAKRLADRITELSKPKAIEICQHEPFSGTHVGPGMLGVFFYGTER